MTERQEKIFNILVKEHIKTAKPVSSKLLEKKCKLDVCPATIRIELQKLTDQGYIEQPHTSAGRVPTSKGYRLFVDKLINEKDLEGEGVSIARSKDEMKMMDSLAKEVASFASSLVFTYLPDRQMLFKEGWEEVLHNPEFKEPSFMEDFLEIVNSLEQNISDFIDKDSDFNVLIGKEVLPEFDDFSLITSSLPEGLMAILGPKRMAYDKNIRIINSVKKCLKKN